MTVDEGVDITKAGDRGVLKRIIREGEGSDTPTLGCRVSVHYTGTLLDGSKFDSSRDRNEPFEFDLGKGTVIKAWDIGVATMKKGEVCMLTCAPGYAYGAAGHSPKIPPNAVLRFEIEMLKWEVEDLSPSKNKSILRYIVEPGSGYDTPNDGALVTVEVEGRVADSQRVFDARRVTFALGEGGALDLPEGLEVALEKFLKGEKSRVTLKPSYGFKAAGHAALGVPPDATLHYTVTLLAFESAKYEWAMDAREKLDQANVFKQKGTDYFKANKYPLAIKMYERVVKLAEDVAALRAESEETRRAAEALALAAHLNVALALLRDAPPRPHDALRHADAALAVEPDNVKGLFRRGAARRAGGDAAAALADFQRVLQLEPNNTAARAQAAACGAAVRAQAQRDRALYKHMFDKFAARDCQMERIRAEREQDVIGGGVGEWGEVGAGAGVGAGGEWTDRQRARAPTHFEKENPNILMLDANGQFRNM